MNLEEVYSLGTSNSNVGIANEGSVTIFNKQRSLKFLDTPILLRCDKWKIAVAGKIDRLQNKSDEEGNTTTLHVCCDIFQNKSDKKMKNSRFRILERGREQS